MDVKNILNVYKQGSEAVVSLVFRMENRIQFLETRVKELEHCTKKNSKNSHKPPSSDGLKKPKVRSLRGKSEKKTGGQPGHVGHTLRQVAEPDTIIRHTLTQCSGCHTSLTEAPIVHSKKRQVFDIPPISFEVTQHETEQKVCPQCCQLEESAFPHHVSNVTQYGPHVKQLIVYLKYHQHLSLERTAEFFRDVCGHSLSQGTINNILKIVSEQFHPLEEQLRTKLLQSPIAHCDETGFRNQGKTEWVHTFSTGQMTLQYRHEKRGKEAMDSIGLLPAYRGITVHDGWASYFMFKNCQHVLCNAHHLRELKGIYEQTKQSWTKELIDLLLDAKKAKERAPGILDMKQLLHIEKEFNRILAEGEQLNPLQTKEKNTKGKQKQTPARNLLNRLINYQDGVLAFLTHPKLPFDNNQAERDIRSIKIQQKISGSFRSEYGADNYLRVKSVFSTLKKQKKSIFHSLQTFMETGTMDVDASST